MAHGNDWIRNIAALSLALTAISATPARAVTVDDIPAEFLEGFDPTRLAFAYYDYRLTPGMEGQFTSFSEGTLSLFDEAQSGLVSLSPEFSWVAGQGWVATGSEATFHWKNVRVPTNDKSFAQTLTLGIDTAVTGVEVTTDNAGDTVSNLRWNVLLETQPGAERKIDINGDKDFDDRVLIVSAKIHPQPNDVFVKVTFKGTEFEQGWVLDQCAPVPEPSAYVLAGFGLISVWWRRSTRHASKISRRSSSRP